MSKTERLLEYIHTMEKKLKAEGYDLEALGYSDEVQDAIDELFMKEKLRLITFQ